MFECKIEIDRPVREVYRVFNDPQNMPRWLTGFQRLEPVRGEPGQVGSVSRHLYLERGRVVELIETITAHDPEKRFAGDISGQGVNCAIEVDFVDLGQRTRVHMRCDVRSKSFMMALLLPLVRGTIHKRQAGDLARLKQLVERGELPTG